MNSVIEKLSEFLHFKPRGVDSWSERDARAREALASLRQHPGFHAYLDILEGETRMLFIQWTTKTLDEDAARDLRLRAIWCREQLEELMGLTDPGSWEEEAGRIYDGYSADQSMSAEKELDDRQEDRNPLVEHDLTGTSY